MKAFQSHRDETNNKELSGLCCSFLNKFICMNLNSESKSTK